MCGTASTYPNVRRAANPSEKTALSLRLQEAERDAAARDCIAELKDFESACTSSSAVIARGLGHLDNLVRGDGLLARYHTAVEAGLRIPQENDFDEKRGSVEAAVHPHYFKDIHYAALSLNGLGPTAYGNYHLQLKEETIRDRASVFEENPFILVKKLDIPLGGNIPKGYRAVWAERHLLAIAKLHSRIHPKMEPRDFPDILLHNDGPATDMLEVHIFGPVHIRALEQVSCKRPSRAADLLIWRNLKTALERQGIRVRELT